MFKNGLHIITALFIMLVFIGCAGDSKNEFVASGTMAEEDLSAEPIPFQFNIHELPDSLTKEQQNAFQLRAKQKFQDFLDYLKIISDPKVDADLVTHSKQLMTELFINDTVSIIDTNNLLYVPFNPSNYSPVLINDLYTSNPLITFKRPIRINSEFLTFNEPLKKDSTGIFKGKMEVQIKTKKAKSIKSINFYLIETNKQFGNEKLKTVEVKLGSIY